MTKTNRSKLRGHERIHLSVKKLNILASFCAICQNTGRKSRGKYGKEGVLAKILDRRGGKMIVTSGN